MIFKIILMCSIIQLIVSYCTNLKHARFRGHIISYKRFHSYNQFSNINQVMMSKESDDILAAQYNITTQQNISLINHSTKSPVEKIRNIIALSFKIQIRKIRLLFAILNNIRAKKINPMIFLPPKLKRNKMLYGLLTLMSKRIFWTRLLFSVAIFTGINRYIAYVASQTTELKFSTFLKLAASAPERISSLRITPSAYLFNLDGRTAITRPVDIESNILSLLIAKGVEFYAPAATVNVLGFLPLLLYLFAMWSFSSKLSQGPPDGNVGKSKEQLGIDFTATFADVAGQETAKREVQEVVEMLRNPTRYTGVGARLPSGILLAGPPGTGKTLLARVTAAEAGVPFYSVSASEFVEVFVGRGAARVRQLFKRAALTAPCIVFIDELDSIGRSRRMGSMNSEQENTLNQLLTCMDGLDTTNNGVIVMGATNRVELLDGALLRAGRFDRIVQCPLPDKNGRLDILKVHTRRMSLSPDADLERVARLSPGCCGADLAAICNEAAIRTARRRGVSTSATDFEDALRTFMSGRGVSLPAMMAEAAGLPSFSSLFKGLGGGEAPATPAF